MIKKNIEANYGKNLILYIVESMGGENHTDLGAEFTWNISLVWSGKTWSSEYKIVGNTYYGLVYFLNHAIWWTTLRFVTHILFLWEKISSWLQQNYLQSILSCLVSLILKTIIKNHTYDSFKQLRKKVENNNGQKQLLMSKHLLS